MKETFVGKGSEKEKRFEHDKIYASVTNTEWSNGNTLPLAPNSWMKN